MVSTSRIFFAMLNNCLETLRGGSDVASAAAPPLRMIDAGAIRAFLTREGVEPYEGSGTARAGVVRVICVRK